ncbi:MAG: ORF6N domain-containing protein [Bacteroidales bacterium]|nr:ORF6N domain-containing protein [Bacteroidales bacterium]
MRLDKIEGKILEIRNQHVLLDSDVAELYGVETREINQAVKNNPDKFPEGYIMETTKDEKQELIKNFDRFDRLKHSTAFPSAFTEKGLYMLATILKSPKATQTTIAIVETFTKIRELTRTVNAMVQESNKEKQKSLMKRSGEIIGDILDNDLEITDTETSIEVNFAMLKIKHTTKRKKNKEN